jgi:hypothetical protein
VPAALAGHSNHMIPGVMAVQQLQVCVDPMQKRRSLKKAAGDMHHMPEEGLDTAVDLDIEWSVSNHHRKEVEQMEGPTAEDQMTGIHHADYGSSLTGPLTHGSGWNATKGPTQCQQMIRIKAGCRIFLSATWPRHRFSSQ